MRGGKAERIRRDGRAEITRKPAGDEKGWEEGTEDFSGGYAGSKRLLQERCCARYLWYICFLL